LINNRYLCFFFLYLIVLALREYRDGLQTSREIAGVGSRWFGRPAKDDCLSGRSDIFQVRCIGEEKEGFVLS
jgi:hypothetical protein